MAPYALRELLPLRGPSLLITHVSSADDEHARCRAAVPPASPFAAQGRVPAFVCLEIAAQAAGAHGSILQQAVDADYVPPRAGYLVVVRDVRLARTDFACGAKLDVSVRTDGAAPPLAIYAFSVRDSTGLIAEGSLGTFVERPQSDLQQNH